jgi:arabinofuranosyltransferase
MTAIAQVALPRPAQDRRLVALLACSLLGVILIRTAWVADEAYITFRTIDNFVHGFGLRWNVAERVQVFTHPLWLFIVGAAYAVTREAYFTVLAISMALTLATMYVMVTRIATDATAATGAAAVLLLSKGFVDFATSGLETPLTFLLLAIFWAVYFRGDIRPATLRTLALIAGLILITDATAAWLVLPALGVALWRDRSGSRVTAVMIAVAPIAAWELFAFVYYGTLLSAPTSARLHAGLTSAALWRHGLVYVFDSINVDPITMAVIIAALAMAAAGMVAGSRPLAAGVALYLLLMMRAGGDAMSGRLLAAPLLCAVAALGRLDLAPLTMTFRLQLLAAVLGLGMMAPRQLTEVRRYRDDPKRYVSEVSGIADQRHLSFLSTGLLNARRDVPWPLEDGPPGGRTPRMSTPHVVVSATPGLSGFFAGPRAHVVDPTGRADALLARLPAERPWHVAVQQRAIPAGYAAALAGPQPAALADPAVARVFSQIVAATRDPIWSGHRFQQIVLLNLENR